MNPDDGKPYPVITELTPIVEDDKIKIQVKAEIRGENKGGVTITEIVLVNTGDSQIYDAEDGVKFEVEESGTYTIKAVASNEKITSRTITIDINQPTAGITIDATPKSLRNTIRTGTQNGVEAGPIKVTITYEDETTELTKQYKVGKKEELETKEWIEVTEKEITIDITENTIVIASYTDGTYNFKCSNYEIKNVDNVNPKFINYDVTISGKTITATGTATDTTSEGAAEGIAEILRYEYQIDNNGYKTTNTFEISTAGTYKIYIKAIDKAGNETVVDKDVTVTNYTVSYDANVGEGAPGAQTEISGVNLTLSNTVPTRTGYIFAGWSTNKTATTAEYSKGGIYTTSTTTTLYAVWSPNTNTKYAVVHQLMNLDGTTYTTDETESKTGTTGASITPAVKTYTGFKSPSTQTVTIGADGKTTVTYKYTRNKYTYTLGTGTGVSTTGSTASGSYYYGATVNLKATVSTGYTWSKWTSSNTNLVANTTTANTTFTMPAGAITMTPSVTINSYTITYNANGGSVSPTNTKANYNASITMPTPTRSYTVTFDVNSGSACANQTAAYTFNGWYTAASGGTKRAYTKMPAYNETVYAQWASKSITLPTPTRTGYAFNGWYSTETSNNGSGTLIGAGGASYTPSANVTLYAKWTATNAAPTQPTTSVTSRGITSFVVNAKSTDSNSDKITYKLYVKTSSASSYILKATSASTASGTAVNLTASGLTSYTVYNYYVTATDGTATTTGTTATTGTGCSGTGLICANKSSYICSSTVGTACTGKISSTSSSSVNKCSTCGKAYITSMTISCDSCSFSASDTFCGYCDGGPSFTSSHSIYTCSQHGYTGSSSSHVVMYNSATVKTCSGGQTATCSSTTLSMCNGGEFTSSSSNRTCSTCGRESYVSAGFICKSCGYVISTSSGCQNTNCSSYSKIQVPTSNSSHREYKCTIHDCYSSNSTHTYVANCEHGYSSSHYYCNTHGYAGSATTHGYCSHGKAGTHYPN